MGDSRMFIRDVEIHPAAAIFPEIPKEELADLSTSISENGVREPLIFLDGKLIDGRNRLRACVMAGIPTNKIPRRDAPGGVDPFLYSWNLNAERRHLTPSQRAAIRLVVMDKSGELEALRVKANENARHNLAPQQQRVPKAQVCQSRSPVESVRIDERLASAAGVSKRTAQTVIATQKRDPAKFEQLARGEGVNRGGGRGRLPADHPLLAKRSAAKNWNVPRAIPALAAFLRERLPSDERLDLARRLTTEEP